MKTIKWPTQAESTYDKTIHDVLLNWNDNLAKSFISDVDGLLLKLSKFNNLCPISKIRSIRRCVV